MNEEQKTKMKTAGEELRRMRIGVDINQVQLAKESGVSQPVISDIETGKKQMTYFAAEGLSKVFGERVWDLAPRGARRPSGYLTTAEAGREMRPTHSGEQVGRLCNDGRIPGAIRTQLDGMVRWVVPKNFRVLGNSGDWGKVSELRKNQIANRYIDGESGEKLGVEFNVHASYPRKLVERGYPRLTKG